MRSASASTLIYEEMKSFSVLSWEGQVRVLYGCSRRTRASTSEVKYNIYLV